MNQVVKLFLMQLGAVIAMLWLSLTIGIMFYADKHPVIAAIMGTTSIIGVCIANAIQTTKGKKNA